MEYRTCDPWIGSLASDPINYDRFFHYYLQLMSSERPEKRGIESAVLSYGLVLLHLIHYITTATSWFKHILFFINCNKHTHIYIVYNKSWDLHIFYCYYYYFYSKTELNDMRKKICLRKPEVSVERNSVSNVTENSSEHGIYSLPCSYTNDIINIAP